MTGNRKYMTGRKHKRENKTWPKAKMHFSLLDLLTEKYNLKN
jgi:frataxin-like iron-binding protein CyaY